MKQNELAPPIGARHSRKRSGRGYGSGHGHTSGRGNKGQNSRSGGGVGARFEGGQLPLVRRLPRKRGFTNIFREEYSIVNVGRLAVFEKDAEVTPEAMAKAGLVKPVKGPIKVLAGGSLDKALVVKANKFSAAAKQKIEAVGGQVEEIGNETASSE
ncbi:MAG: 50S ribosomal protein L15 [Chloroflexota bacterium]